MSNMNIIQFLDTVEPSKSEALLEDLKLRTLEELYCDSVDYKRIYSKAYNRLKTELHKREQLELEKLSNNIEKGFGENSPLELQLNGGNKQ